MAKKLALVIKLLISGLLLFSSYVKVSNPESFVDALKAYLLFSENVIAILVYYVPVLEFTLALGLLAPKYTRVSQLGLLILFAVFQLLLLSLIIRGIEADCGCFGKFGGTPQSALVRNFIIIAALAWCFIKFPDQQNTDTFKNQDC